MTGRAFRVKVQLDVHAITCPGVWLCPNGKVILRISTLDSSAESCRISPVFPLLFHEKFAFEKIFSQRGSLTELQSGLEEEFLYAELIQWGTPASQGITLATFETNLADLLYPVPCFKGLLAGVDVDLLMDPTKYFPGIIAPKIEVSTKTNVEEILGYYDTSISKCIINPKMINSKIAREQRKRPIKGIVRQRRVCHTKPRSQSCQPYRQGLSESQHPLYASRSCIDRCYHSARNFTCTCQPDFRKSAEPTVVYENTHITDSCPICFKYNCYFPKCYGDSDVVKKYNIDCNNTQRYSRNMSHIRECNRISRNDVFDLQEVAMPLSQSQNENLQKNKKKWYASTADNVEECDPRYDYIQDYSAGRGFYKSLEKFYKRMYKQAKMRAREADV
ncbi:spermatogenesis-associated protein 6 isoform X2 [Cardiocondyla obscurior]|uniref:spermatogenesis-associated protein 6 isoform X2 n=1 Tax=Cardiocondyla obscurior TaxID=286306 RepID=UPI0039655E2A